MSFGEFVDFWVLGLAIASLKAATPLTLAALGGLFSERSGVVNIALEGFMIIGAFFAIFGSDKFGHWVFGLLLAMVLGGVFSLLHAFASVTLGADQIISGTALILLATGLADFLNISIYGPAGTPSDVSRVWQIPGDVPVLGGTSLLVPVMIGLVFLTSYVVFKTPFGLHLRAVGEHPKAADTVGIDVHRMRYIGVFLSGVLAGLAGAYLAFNVGNYSQGMTAGYGFIALAALIFGKWNPFGAFLASLLFGFASALGTRLQSLEAVQIPPEFVTALPYVLTIIALAGVVGKSIPPAAIGRPYVKG